jgi:thiol-disulfide isomerase/thioredoxin
MVFIRGRGRASIIYALGLILSFCIGCGSGEPSVGERTVSGRTGLTGIEDLNGHPVDPLAHMTNKAEVFVFVATDCPISNRYAPELRRLAEKFKANGVRFRLVYPNADDSSPLIQKHVADFSLSMPVIRDLEHTLVRTAKVRVTPEAAVFLPDGTLIYHGRIDDQYVDFGKDRPEPTQRDLQQVLTDLLAGRRLTESSTRAVGCNIPER